MDAVHVDTGISIVLKWNSRLLWTGVCDRTFTVENLLALLEAAFQPFLGCQAIRLICHGKVWYNVTLEELMRLPSSPLVFHLQFQTAGGAGEKANMRTYIKNTTAATLLEHGYPFDWTASTVDQLLTLAGTKHMAQLMAMPQGHARLEQILQTCRNCAITIPEQIAVDARQVSSKGAQQTREKKRQIVQPNLQNYQVEMSFLRNEDASTPVQLSEVSPHKTGLVLLSMTQAQSWIKEERLLTKDELTLAIVGHHDLDTKLDTHKCTLPCTDQTGRPVIIAVTLCHLGERKIHPISDVKKVDEKACQTIALTLWKDDFGEVDWTKALDHTFAFVKQLLSEHSIDTCIESMWGRSIRGENKQRSTSHHAVSIQIHVAVQISKVAEFLRATGFCKVFATPKTVEGRVSDQWRVIWVEGDQARLHSLASQTAACAGLVRNQKTWGLRYLCADFEAAWRIIHGSKQMPMDLNVRCLYRVEPLPHGCTAEMLQEWSKLLAWPFKAIKALGPRSWLLGSSGPPPAGVHTFNTCPVLLKLVPPTGVQESSPILAGPKPSRQPMSAQFAGQDPFYDPWAGSATHKKEPSVVHASAAPARNVQGPIEARFVAQDEKLAQMEQTIQQIQRNQQQLRHDTEQGFKAVEKRDEQFHQAMSQVRNDLEQSFTKALASQSTQLNSTLDDLKRLLTKPKRTRAEKAAAKEAGEEDEEMSE
eukprot:Skav225205  [mRNA]  locus=scaffold1041:81096:83207:- [translate_table: standard]